MKQNKKSVLAVILARGGSKGIKKKNIKKIQNHPFNKLFNLCRKKQQIS